MAKTNAATTKVANVVNPVGEKARTIIIAIEERWVFVQRTDGSAAACVRNWGTTAGLGQLAMCGPQSATVLDPAGILRVAPGKVLFELDCCNEVWDKVQF